MIGVDCSPVTHQRRIHMGKGLDKKPAKTLEEKRLAKKEKKAARQ
jgi:hypothetical protein